MFSKQSIQRFIGWFFLINGLVFLIVGYGYLYKIIASESLFNNSFVDYSSSAGKVLIVFFAGINYFWYMIFLAFIPALFLLLVSYFLPNKRLIWTLSIICGTLSLTLLIINNCLFSMYKFHLNASIWDLVFYGQWYDVFDFSTREIKIALLTLGSICVLESAIAYWVWNSIIIPQKYLFGRTIASVWLGCFLISYFTLLQSMNQNNNLFSQQTPNLPFYNQLIVYLIPDKNAADILYRYSEEHFSQPLFSNDKVHYPQQAMQCDKPTNPPNIILIMVDSLRYDSLQKSYMPQLTRFAQRSWQFKQYLSAGNATQPGLFSLFYSIPGSYWTAMLEQKIPPVFVQLLLQYHYLTEILWSSEMINPPFDKTIYAGITPLAREGSVGEDIGDRDRQVTRQALQFLAAKHTQPFFLNLFYDAPHGYCREQHFPQPFQPAISECERMAMSNEMDPLPYYNRYLNTVRFVDGEIAAVLASIEQQGYLNDSIVIITADHGQEFNDSKQNYWGHAGNFTKAQVQVPLIIHWPQQAPKTINYLTSSYDVMPTLLRRVFHCQNPIIDYSIGQDLLVNQDRLPFVLAGSYSNMGLIERDRLTTIRTSGAIVVTGVRAEPVAGAEPRLGHLKKALELMRLYYVK